LEPEFERAATDLKYIVYFGAIDVERVPKLSQAVMKKYSFSIEGVPSMRLITPGSLTAQEYRGERTARAMKAAAYAAMPSHVDVVTAANLDKWLEKGPATMRKAVLFSSKSSVPPLFKGISSAYLGHISFAQVTIADLAAPAGKPLAERFALVQLPTLVVLRRSADEFEDSRWQARMFEGKDFATLSFGAAEKPSFRKVEGWLMGYSRQPKTAPASSRARRRASTATEL